MKRNPGNRRLIASLAAAGAASLPVSGAAGDPPRVPNIVIIMTDQQRADLCKREGYPLDTMPFLDSLAKQGAWFSRAYTSMPVCGPARISMLTGRYPGATHVRTNWNIPDAFYDQDMFGLFRDHGYTVGLCGKNHSHLNRDRADFWYEAGHLGINDPERTSEEKAFDEYLKGTHHHLDRKPCPFPVECQIPHRLVSKAGQWVKSVSGRPFLLWLSFPEPHNPYQVPEPYYSMFPPGSIPPPRASEEALAEKDFKHRWVRQSFEKAFPDYEESIPRARANYLGMLRLLDDEIARFVGMLKEQGLLENTIIVFLSDHGDYVGEYGLLRKGAGLDEALTRIPLVFRGPGIQPSRTPRLESVSICDILPTLCDATGIPVPKGVQGRSLWPILSGSAYPAGEFDSVSVEHGFGGLNYTGEETLDPATDGLHAGVNGEYGGFDCLNSWTQSGTLRSVRKGKWKIVYDAQDGGRLYDLDQDPAELRNLYDSKDHTAVRAELMEELLTWTLRLQDPLPLPRNRYVIKTDPHNYLAPHTRKSEVGGTKQPELESGGTDGEKTSR